jgi:hypothetical protein
MVAHPLVDGRPKTPGIFGRVEAGEREIERANGVGDLAVVEPPPTGRDRVPSDLELLSPEIDALGADIGLHPPHLRDPVAADGMVVDTQALLAQFRRIEDTLRPVVGAAVEQRAGDTMLANQMVQIIELLEQLGARLGNGRPRDS